MDLHAFFEAIEHSPPAVTIAQDALLFPLIETVHVIALTLVVGSIGLLDLRLLGWVGKERPLDAVMNQVLPWTWSAFGVALITGTLLFISAATRYTENWFFISKMALMALAAVNMLVFHLVTHKTAAAWNEGPPPLMARLAGGTSLLLWGGIVTCGRWIGFT